MQVPVRQNEAQVDPIARGACDVAATQAITSGDEAVKGGWER